MCFLLLVQHDHDHRGKDKGDSCYCLDSEMLIKEEYSQHYGSKRLKGSEN